MNKFVILRHGESTWNRANKFTGWIDVDLSDKGIKEAKAAGKLLNQLDLEFDIAYTSLLIRAKNTLKYCLKQMKSDKIEIIEDWRLNERHYGALQGLNKKETVKENGEEQVKIWRRSYDIPPPQLSIKDHMHPANQKKYAHLNKSILPSTESLKIVDRFLPMEK